MKIAILITVVALVMLLGMAWVLAYFQVIPAQKMADKTPALAPILVGLHVAKAKAKTKPKVAAVAAQAGSPGPPSPAAQLSSLDAEKEALAAEKEQLDAQKAVLAKKLASAENTGDDGSTSVGDGSGTDPKVISIYSTMKADQLALIFAKLPDSAVADALEQLDDRQAGKVLAALPNDRAAKLTVLMSHLKPASAAPPTATAQ